MNDVIAAISTPYGRGGIAVLRISGDGAIECADKMFRLPSGRRLCDVAGGSVVYGEILHSGERIDDGCAAVFRAPRSFTGEDTVEISCHGGVLITQKVLESILACGARPALGGEFSKRAFISGKMSLTEAESIMDIIDAESDDALKVAAAAQEGILSKKIDALHDRLVALLSQVYVYIDYPDEDLTDVTSDEAADILRSVLSETNGLLATYSTGRAVSKGISAVICGRPNTGKSSLLNRILGRERAIVTDVAGTTRDTIEENAMLGQVPLHLVDTAGLHETGDRVEALGVERSRQSLEDAELVFAVFDASKPLTAEDGEVLAMLRVEKRERTVIVLNKTDVDMKIAEADFEDFPDVIKFSCRTGEGMDALAEAVNKRYIDGRLDLRHDAVISNARQYAALKRAQEALENALCCLQNGTSPDVAGLDIEDAIGALGQLDGRSVGEEIVHGIFSRFCVGK